MLNIRELREREAELKRQGNALWEKSDKESQSLQGKERTAYMDEVRAQDVEIFSSLTNVQQMIERAMAYQEEERAEILKAGKNDTPAQAKITGRNEFSSFGQMLQAVACAQSNIIAADFRSDYRDELGKKLSMYQAAASGMSTAIPSDGGYLVRKDWTDEFLTRARGQSVVLPLCRRIPVSGQSDSLEYPYIDESSRADGSRFGGVQIFWAAEASTVTAKQPKIGKGELRLEELMGLSYATRRLLQDAPALEAVLTQAFEEEFGFVADNAIVRGTGAGQPLGILNSPVLVSVTRSGTDDLDTILAAYEAMPGRLKAGAVWLHHANWFTKFIKLKIGDTPVFIAPGGIGGTPNGMLLGRPAIELEQCSAVGTPGDLIFGNFGQYIYIEKEGEGLRFDSSMHIRFLFDEMAFRWIYRLNGQPVARTSLTRFSGATPMSPFVTVAT